MIDNDIKIYDNLISDETADLIEKMLTGADFPWYLSASPDNYTLNNSDPGTLNNSGLNVKEYIQLVHNFLSEGKVQSPFFDQVHKLFVEFQKQSEVPIEGYYRVKANLQTQCSFSSENFSNTPHIDTPINHMVAIYYVNNTDGDTVILENNNDKWEIAKRITPKKGRFLVFNGKYYHAGRHPNVGEKRLVINFNFV